MNIAQPAQTYLNVMELLVVEEVAKQLKHLPPKVANYVNQAESIAYALNRLPSLYATSQKGLQQQQARAKKEFHDQIVAAVRQALAAVQRDPLRTVTPLKLDEDRDAQEALRGLKELLGVKDLAWGNLVDVVEQTLIHTARGEVTWHRRGHAPVESREWLDNRYIL